MVKILVNDNYFKKFKNKPIFTLKRVSHITDGMFGVLIDNEDKPFAVTLENSELYIDSGLYVCKKTTYHKHNYPTYEVTGVPGRTRILIHLGNLNSDSRGCICIGENFTFINGKTAIGMSRSGFKEFMSKLSGINEFTIIITDFTYKGSEYIL